MVVLGEVTKQLESVEPPEEGQGPLIEGGCNHRHWRAPVRTEHVTKCWFSEHTHSSLEAGDSVVAGEGTCVVRGSSSLSRFAGSVNTELSISVSGLLWRLRVSRPVSSPNTPSSNEVSSLMLRSSDVSEESPRNTPASSDANSLSLRLSDVSEESPSNAPTSKVVNRLRYRLSSSSASSPSKIPASRVVNGLGGKWKWPLRSSCFSDVSPWNNSLEIWPEVAAAGSASILGVNKHSEG